MQKIFIVSHKPIDIKLPDGYAVIRVGNSVFDAHFCDSEGDHIADKNPYYCELTALYWIWKNYQCPPDTLVGLFHYRRILVEPKLASVIAKRFVSLKKFQETLANYDIIIPPERGFYGGLYAHYSREHEINDLDLCMDAIHQSSGAGEEFKTYMKSARRGSIGNMFITRKAILDRYCSWLFPILFSVEESLLLNQRDSYQRRAPGFLAERLFNPWRWSQSDLRSIEYPIIRSDKSVVSNFNNYRRSFWRL